MPRCRSLAGSCRLVSPLRHAYNPSPKDIITTPSASSSDAEIIAAPGSAAPAFDPVTEVARQNLSTAANACRRYGWIAFWVQLVLTSVASVIVLFSMAFTSQTGPQISLYLTLFGIVMGYLSTFWSFGYTRLSRKLRAFLDFNGTGAAPKIRRTDVINMLEKGAIINALGAGASMLGLQATIGLLVAKTLTTATVNPFLASSTTTWNPVLAFDVFNVQATTNALLSHFFSLLVSLWLLRTIANRPSAANVMAKAAVV
ncbi:hypothetical protein KSW81_004649 [Nannochloris sp. 'desiccata']|nr:hypothetical protein KSW81_004649 [Chlorella desiccata (nom. nud.)]